MQSRSFRRRAGLALVLAAALGGSALAAPGDVPAQSDEIDAFMEEVLAQREVDWDELYNHVFTEIELFRFEDGLEVAPIDSWRREFTWYVRDGYLVRSPYAINGVEVAAEEREEAELRWIESIDSGARSTQIERDSFFGFEFEPGNYYFAGREEFEGREVVRIEYYPRTLFSDEEEPDEEDDFDQAFDKTSRVVMLILPEERQIVRMIFENLGLEFLPFSWMVRVEDLAASLTMHRPLGEVWLPREITATAKVTLAQGSIAFEYSRRFFDYKQTAVGAGVIYGRPKR